MRLKDVGKKSLIIGILLSVGFLVGFGPQYAARQDLAYQNRKLKLDLQLTRLRGELAMSAFEAERKNFAVAVERSNNFFANLDKQIKQTDSFRKRARLEKIAEHQQEITDLLNKNDRAAAEKLAQLYLDLFEVSEPLPERMADNQIDPHLQQLALR